MDENTDNIRIKDDTNENDDGYYSKEKEDKNLLDKANFSKSTFPDHLQRLEVVGTELGSFQSRARFGQRGLLLLLQVVTGCY